MSKSHIVVGGDELVRLEVLAMYEQLQEIDTLVKYAIGIGVDEKRVEEVVTNLGDTATSRGFAKAGLQKLVKEQENYLWALKENASKDSKTPQKGQNES